MKEDWNLLLRFLPPGWEALAVESGALKGLRKDKSPENLLRMLLLHLGCGHSLRETAVRGAWRGSRRERRFRGSGGGRYDSKGVRKDGVALADPL